MSVNPKLAKKDTSRDSNYLARSNSQRNHKDNNVYKWRTITGAKTDIKEGNTKHDRLV